MEITGWTQIGAMDLNWDRYLKFRIGPDFFSTDLVVIMNQKKWNSLSPKSREVLQAAALRHESDSVKQLADLRTRELAELDKRGVKFVAQSAEASRRFIEGARSASLLRMKERMEKAGGMENYDRMVKLHSGS